MTDRITRVNALLRREIGEALFRVLANRDVDLSAVTITEVSAARNLRSARVRVSVRGTDEERKRMLNLLRARRTRIQDLINRDLSIKYTPRLVFELDGSLEKGDRVLGLLSELEIEEDPSDESPQAGDEASPTEE